MITVVSKVVGSAKVGVWNKPSCQRRLRGIENTGWRGKGGLAFFTDFNKQEHYLKLLYNYTVIQASLAFMGCIVKLGNSSYDNCFPRQENLQFIFEQKYKSLCICTEVGPCSEYNLNMTVNNRK